MKLGAVDNQLDVELEFTNLQSQDTDNRPLPVGVTYTFGKYMQGCDIPTCTGSINYSANRMIIVSLDASGDSAPTFACSLFSYDNATYVHTGVDIPFNGDVCTAQQLPTTSTGAQMLTISSPTSFELSDTDVPSGGNVKLIAVKNNLDSNVSLRTTNLRRPTITLTFLLLLLE